MVAITQIPRQPLGIGTIHVFRRVRNAALHNLALAVEDVVVCYGYELGAFQAARAVLHEEPQGDADWRWVYTSLEDHIKPGGHISQGYRAAPQEPGKPRAKVDHPTERDLDKLGGPSRLPVRVELGGFGLDYVGPGKLQSVSWRSDGRLELIIEEVHPSKLGGTV